MGRGKCGHVGKYSGADYCSEDCAMEAHDYEHDGDPKEYWDECSICAQRVEGEIEEGKRTPNGDLIPEDRAIEADAFPEK